VAAQVDDAEVLINKMIDVLQPERREVMREAIMHRAGPLHETIVYKRNTTLVSSKDRRSNGRTFINEYSLAKDHVLLRLLVEAGLSTVWFLPLTVRVKFFGYVLCPILYVLSHILPSVRMPDGRQQGECKERLGTIAIDRVKPALYDYAPGTIQLELLGTNPPDLTSVLIDDGRRDICKSRGYDMDDRPQ
jgi:hypothetical protein